MCDSYMIPVFMILILIAIYGKPYNYYLAILNELAERHTISD